MLDNFQKAYAKVNLHLEILNRRSDNYHSIFSLMANINLYDLLKLGEIKEINSSEVNGRSQSGRFDTMKFFAFRGKNRTVIKKIGGFFQQEINLVPDKSNLISKATDLYLSQLNKEGEIEYSLEKNIPLEAGLGGGSSNAALAVKLLNQKLDFIDKEKLDKILFKLGADVPFCFQGGWAFCTGRGEQVEPLKKSLDCSVLLVNDGIKINTKQAYQSLQRESGKVDEKKIVKKKQELKKILEENEIFRLKSVCQNDFEKVIFADHPQVKDIKDQLYELGADFSIMSGSGSTLIGLFREKEKALKAKSLLDKKYKMVFLTNFI